MFAQLLLVMLAALALTIVATKRGWQAPLLLAIAGAAVSFVPGLPRLELSPEVILSVVLPPLLFSATQDFSVSGFVRRWRSITNLGIVLVIVTTAVVGAVATQVIPWITLPMALVLAAVVSPPDAVTAVAIGGRLGLPARVLNTLKGESLVNDAAALTLFSVTVSAAAGDSSDTFIDNPVTYFLFTSVVGVLVGFALGHAAAWVRARLNEPSLMTAFAVLLPFGAYLVAEEIHGSGVLAVVMAGFVLSRHSLTAVYATRLAEREVWNIVDVLLEAFVFAYLGLQFHFLLQDAITEDAARPFELLGAGVAVLVAVVLVRVAWVLAGGFVMRNLLHGRLSAGGRHFTFQEDVVIAWTGMRGVVTLAAAAGIPEDFPHRADLQVLAFVVAVGSLLLQGSTLPALIRRLQLDTSRERQWREKQQRKAREISRSSMFEVLRAARAQASDPRELEWVDMMLSRADRNSADRAAEQEENEGLTALARRGVELRREMLLAQRSALLHAEENGTVDEEAVREALDQLDLEEASLAHRGSPRL